MVFKDVKIHPSIKLFYAALFPRDVLDEILNLIESVSEGFPTYFYIHKR